GTVGGIVVLWQPDRASDQIPTNADGDHNFNMGYSNCPNTTDQSDLKAHLSEKFN
ncbi:hypothetical protein CRM22_010781, partial [Opisthorchis felineus]